MRCSCCVLLYVTKLEGAAGKRTPWGSWSPRTPRVRCVLGARTPHEFLTIIVRLDSSKGHLIRIRKIGRGWISYSRMGAFSPKISTYITTPEFIVFRWISACLSCCSFSYQVSVFNYSGVYLSVDSGYYSLYILGLMYISVRYSGYCWYWVLR